MPASVGNRDFRHSNVLRYDGRNLHEVGKAMRVVLGRRPGEDLRPRPGARGHADGPAVCRMRRGCMNSFW